MADSTKTILIGGITGGIGRALASQLKEQGHNVTGFARNQEAIDKLNDELGIKARTCDATSPEEVENFFKQVVDEHESIDAYVHAIGSIYIKPAHMTSPEDWHKTIETNLTTAFLALRSATKFMQKQNSGSCLFFSTAAAQTGIANHEAIAAAKGGIEAMVRSAAASYASRGLRFNAIAPSITDTPLAKPIVGSEPGRTISERMHPLGQIGQAEDIASLAAWLVSDAAKNVTGQTFVSDGGISKIVPKPKA